jgi:SAM-dependent methyltransferase
MNETLRHVQELGTPWSGPYPSSPYKMDKIVDLAGASILDIGCAAGTYVAFCQRLGKQVQGIDINLECLGQAISTFGLSFTCAVAGALPFADRSFDTVMMWDVLEHTRDDRLALGEAIRVAKKNVLLSVPKQDSEKIFNSANGLTYRHFIDPDHRRYYTPKGISRLIKSLGPYRIVVEHWCQIHPVAVYKGVGVPRLVTATLDRLLWLLTRDKQAFLRNLFVEIRL